LNYFNYFFRASYIASGASASTENTTKDEGGEKIR
jgi:hypothetical protein